MIKLFKNGVGRPSNEILRKRKLFCLGIAGCIVTLIVAGLFTLNHLNVINLMGASATSKCVFPYKSTNCSGIKNNTVKKAQELLKKEGFYKDTVDGYFGPKTVSAVKRFQKRYKMTQDGHMGIATLKKLAEETGTRYYVIKYSLNGGTGTLTNTMKVNKEPTQFIFYGVKQEISPTKLTKKNSVHVGWSAKTVWNRTEYEYGCTTNDCSDSSKTLTWYARTTRGNKKEDSFKKYYYDIGTTVSHTGSKGNGQLIVFTAQYCKTGYKFDKTKSICVPLPKTTKKKTTKKTTTTKKKTTTTKSNGKYTKPTGTNYTIFVASVCQEDASGYTGAKWVVDTIFNRVDASGFPNTPWKVLTQKNQFEAYGAGHYKRRLSGGKLKSECNQAKKAVDDAFANPKNRAHNYKYFLAYRKYSSDVKVGDNYYRSKY